MTTASTSPVLSQVNFNSGRLVVNWVPISGSTYFLTQVYLGTTAVTGAKAVNMGFGAQITPNPPLADDQSYTVQTAQSDSSGNPTSAFSQPFNVIQNPVTGIGAIYDGKQVVITWTPPAYGNPSGAVVSLFQQGNNSPLVSESVSGTSATLVPPIPLEPSQTYTVQVQPSSNGGGSIGPASSVTLILTQPVISSMTYDLNTQLVEAYATPPYPSGVVVTITLYRGTEKITSNPGIGNITASATLDSATLDYSAQYRATLRNSSGTILGPESMPMEIVISPPVLQSLTWQTTQVSAAWSNLPTRITPTGGRIGLIGDGTGIGENTVQGYSGSVSVPGSPSYSTYQIEVYATYGNSRGPFAGPITVPSTAPVIASVSIENQVVTIDWTAITGAPGYRVTLNDGQGTALANLVTSATTAAITAPLAKGGVYSATVQQYGVSGGVTLAGPMSDSVSVIAPCPAITGVTAGSSSVTVTWQAIDNAASLGITGFGIGLFHAETLQIIGNSVAVSGATATSGEITTLPTAGTAAVARVWSTGSKTTGAKSEPADILFNAPILSAVLASASNVALAWQPVSGASGYLVTWTSGGAQSANLATPSASLPGDATGIAVAAVNGVATGPSVSVPDPLTAKATLSSVIVDKGVVTVAWGTVSAAPGFRVAINDAQGAQVAVLSTQATTAAIATALAADQAYTATVQQYTQSDGMIQAGPMSDSVSVIAPCPAITGVTAGSSAVTVTWQAIDNAATLGITGFSIVYTDPETGLVQGDAVAVQGATATSGDLPLPDQNNTYAVTVWATGANQTTGTRALPVPVIAAAATILEADIGASSVSLRWSSVLWPAISRYKITLYEQGKLADGVVAYATSTEAKISNTLTVTQTLAVVQAVNDMGEGPSSAAVNLYGSSPSYYPQPVSSNDNTPCLVRSATNQPAPYDIVLALPDIFLAGASVPSTIAVGAFTLSASGNASYPYKVTIPAGSVAWQFDPSSRTTLFANFTAFLLALETQSGTIIIQDGALTMVRQTLALALPLLYVESLLYMYGFDPANDQGGYVDLVAGMQLSIANEVYQFSEPGGNPNGYVGSGETLADLHTYLTTSTKTGFDAFLSAMGRPQVPPPSGGGAAIIDLYAPAGRRLYYRLLYPRDFPGVTNSDTSGYDNRTIILGANTFADLQNATADYEQNLNFNSSPNVSAVYLRGRAVPTPRLPVRIDSSLIFVALGTTVADLLAKLNGLPQCQTRAADGFRFQRAIGNLIDLAQVGNVSANALPSAPVRLNLDTTVFSSTALNFLDLPVYLGDALSTMKDS